jgi:DNA-directed RNA polymerase subunit M/transcription elongation factor TFIIS
MLPEHDSNDAFAELTCPECGEEEALHWLAGGPCMHCESCGHEWDPRDDGDDDYYDYYDYRE